MRYSNLSQEMKGQRRTAVLLLRFRTVTPTKLTTKYLSFSKIAKIVNLDYNSVQYICTQATEVRGPRKVRHPLRKLEQEHIEFLTSEHTLEE